jgi:hypothetical protein
MSETERTEATENAMTDLKERREAKAVAPHHVPLNSFHDTRANIDSIVKEVNSLHHFFLLSFFVFILLSQMSALHSRAGAHCCAILFRPLQSAFLFQNKRESGRFFLTHV